MSVEKLRNYNQKVYAILGTLLVVIATISLVFLLYFIADELFRSYRRSNRPTGILAENKVEQLQQEKKRQQLISYEMPELVDTVGLVYMIPVGQKTLKKPEAIDDGVLEMLDTFGSVDKAGQRYSSSFWGSYNNLLIYDAKTKTTEKLFEGRISFSQIDVEYFDDDIFILFTAASADSNSDGVINQRDLSHLNLYSLSNRRLLQIGLEGLSVEGYKLIEGQKDLLIVFGSDSDHNGEYNQGLEPLVLKRFNLESEALEPVVPTAMHIDLQQKLEGSKE